MAAGKRSGNRYRRGWSDEEIIAKIREWEQAYGEPPRRSDWDPAEARKYMDEMQERALVWAERVAIYESGDWPSARHVSERFGSWNTAIEAADLQPRAPGQRTPRGVTPSPRLLVLGHVINEVYQADRAGDDERLALALGQLATVARRLARQVGQAAQGDGMVPAWSPRPPGRAGFRDG